MKRYLFALLAACTLGACTSSTGPISRGNADIEGKLIQSSIASDHGLVRLLVTDLSIRPKGYKETDAILLADQGTPVYIRDGAGSLRKASVSELTLGAVLLARVSDVVLDSKPAQFGAIRIDATR